jgi:hypothetical protein
VSVVPAGSGWTSARIDVGGLSDSLRIWPMILRAFLLTCPGAAGPGLVHRVDLIRSLSASWRDPSQIRHPVTPPRPVPTSAEPWKEREAAKRTGEGLPVLTTVQTSEAVRLSSCFGVCGGCGRGEGGVFVVVLAGGQAVVQAAEEPAEEVALGGGVPVSGVAAAVVVGAGAG